MAQLEPMLKHFGKVFFIGERPGMGQTMKLANNLLSATALMYKDVELCPDEAEAAGVSMWVASSVRQLWQRAYQDIGPEKDFTTIVQLLERWAGVEVKPGSGNSASRR